MEIVQKVLVNYAYAACLFVVVFHITNATLESCLFISKSNSRANEWIIRKTILQRSSVIWNEQLTNETERVLLLSEI